MRILILGSSGFIGSNLVAKLQSEGHFVCGIDIVKPLYSQPDFFMQDDLRHFNSLFNMGIHYPDIEEVYCLACCMGGMGFIGNEKEHGYDIAVGSTLIVANTIESFKYYPNPVKIFYSSSACVYNQDFQKLGCDGSLRESHAIPANPDLLYGWQKLFSEKMFEASGLNVRIARFHNIFGEYGCYDGGKEKAPAALCRKVALAKDSEEIEVWGDGSQLRSFLYISECLEGVERLMKSDFTEPINIGSDESISINNLAYMIMHISGKKLEINNIRGNVGVENRNSNNELIEKVLGWKPSASLHSGMEKLFFWINNQVNSLK